MTLKEPNSASFPPDVETHGLLGRLTALRETRFKRVSIRAICGTQVAVGFNPSGNKQIA